MAINAQALADELNRLLATETRSLVRHLDEAKPYLTPKTYRIWNQVEAMSHASAEHSQRLSALFEALEMVPRPIGYPAEVANYHFLTLSSLLPLLIQEKRKQIEAYSRAIDHAAGDPRVHDELAALLTENREQLRSLEASESGAGHGSASSAAGAR